MREGSVTGRAGSVSIRNGITRWRRRKWLVQAHLDDESQLGVEGLGRGLLGLLGCSRSHCKLVRFSERIWKIHSGVARRDRIRTSANIYN